MKNRLVFDVTDVDTLASSDTVGAVLFDQISGETAAINASRELATKDADVLAQLISGVTVSATNLDIRDLTAVSDSVAAHMMDGSGNALSSTTGSLNVNVTNTIDSDEALANTAIKTVAEVVGVAAAQILDGADLLADRKYVSIFNNSSKLIYIGPAGVTAANGYPIYGNVELTARIGAAVAVHAIGAGANLDLRTLQLS